MNQNLNDLPEPLVPAEVDLNGLGFMPLQVSRVMQSKLFGMSNGDEFKAAFALWCASWTEVPAGSLPPEDEMLEFLSRAKQWKKVRARALSGWFKCSDGRLYHRTIAALAISAWERREEWREVQDNRESRQKRWREKVKRAIPNLRGKDLACFCPLDQPCHADVLLELANAPLREGEDG